LIHVHGPHFNFISLRQVHQDDLDNLAFVHLKEREKKESRGRRGEKGG